MGLFNRGACDICGGKATLMGNIKLADGEMCKRCAEELSPFLTGRKELTVAQVMQHLDARRANAQELSTFQTTRIFGTSQKMYIDETNQRFLITYRDNWDDNPDIIYFSQVLSCDPDISENIRSGGPRPDERPGEPGPEQEIREYEFDVVIRLNHPWFNMIRFNLSSRDVPDIYSDEYYALACDSVMIHNILMPDYQMEMPTRAVRPVPPPPRPRTVVAPVPPIDNRPRPAGGPVHQPGPQGGPAVRPNPQQMHPQGAQPNRPMGMNSQPNRPQGMNNGQPNRPQGQSSAQQSRPMGQSSAQQSRPGMNNTRPGQPTKTQSSAQAGERKPMSSQKKPGPGGR